MKLVLKKHLKPFRYEAECVLKPSLCNMEQLRVLYLPPDRKLIKNSLFPRTPSGYPDS